MRRSIAIGVIAGIVALAACEQSTQPPEPSQRAPAPLYSTGQVIEGSYIVVLNDGADPRSVLAVLGINPRFVYTAALNGFAAELNRGQVTALQRNPNVAYLEQDQEVTLNVTQTMTVGGGLWGLDRTDERDLPLSGSYTYTRNGSGVYAYVIDTGIYTGHGQFGGRARNVYDAFGGSGSDCNGHGTHVSGTIGGSTYGIAKGVQLRGVRVLNCSGSGSYSGIIAGVDWVRANRANPAVANLSLGGGFSSAVNSAVNNLANSGVFVAVAAGNSSANACNYSPASASAATTVASSTKTDARSSFSNYGSCVDTYAPGSSVLSAWIGGSGATRTISGTSMASPHVAGVAALYKATFGNASSSTIDSWIKSNATLNHITGNPSGTPNRLLYKSTL